MKQRKIQNPYSELLDKLNREGVKYVVIGMAGINYYAKKTDATFATQDYDIFIKPVIENIRKSISILEKLGYDTATSEGKATEAQARDIARFKQTVVATDSGGITFELLLEMSGYNFTDMYKDARIFTVQKIPIRVGKLAKLLRSKKLAGREKDKAFLKRFENC